MTLTRYDRLIWLITSIDNTSSCRWHRSARHLNTFISKSLVGWSLRCRRTWRDHKFAGAVTSILYIDDDDDDDDGCGDDDDDDDKKEDKNDDDFTGVDVCNVGNAVILALRSYRLMVKMSRIDWA